jgi:DNA polymerase-3 subunit beta
MLVTEDKLVGQMKSPVKLIFEPEALIVRSESIISRVEDTLPINLEGDPMMIGFNCRILIDALRVANVDKIRLSLTSALMSMTIEPVEVEENNKFLLLVLPVRLGGAGK